MNNIKFMLALVSISLLASCARPSTPTTNFKKTVNSQEETISADSIELTGPMIANLKAKGVIKTK